MEYKHTPPMILERGYVSIRDLEIALGLSHSGIHDFFKRVGFKPHRIRIGRGSYYSMDDVNKALDAVEGRARQRAPKRKKNT